MTKGSVFLRTALFFCSSLVFLSENFTSERCFFITPVGHFGPRVPLDEKEPCVKKSQVNTKDGVSVII